MSDPPLPRDRGPLAALLFTISAIWIATASRHALGGDNGELATLAVTGGAAHPPGYPLVALYLHAMRWLPATSPAHASSLANAIVAVGALCVLARACIAWGASRASTGIACLAWGLGSITWALATQAEVFAANALFAASILWLASPEAPLAPRGRSIALALVAGLALANHYTIATLAPLGLYAFVRAVRASSRPTPVVLLSAVALVLGASPYAFLFVAAKGSLDPASWSWGDVHDGRSLLAYVSRSDYPASAINEPGHVLSQIARVTWALAGLPLLVIAGAALWLARARAYAITEDPRGAKAGALGSWVALTASIACAGPAFMTVFHVPLEGLGGAVTERFDLLPMTLLVPGIARALDELAGPFLSRPVVASSSFVLLLAVLGARGLPELHARQRTGVEVYAENALLVAPEHAIILGTGDARLGALLYARYARGARPDVTFVSARLLLSPWYHARIERALGVALPDVQEHSLDVVALLERLLATGRPVFVTDWFSPKALDRIPSYPMGPLVRLVPRAEDVLSPEEVETENLAFAARFRREALPLAGPEPWSDELAADYARPWDALAQMFSRRGDAARAEANARRGAEARRAASWW